MSLYHLGISSPLSPLRRQFSSPLAAARRPPIAAAASAAPHHHDDDDSGIDEDSESDADADDVSAARAAPDSASDSRDVLVARLNGLVRRLAHDSDRDSIAALHAKVDEMELVLAPPPGPATDGNVFWRPPPPLLTSPFPDEPLPEPLPVRPAAKSKVSSDVVEKMVAEAEVLCQELSAVVQSLQDRREESDARCPFLLRTMHMQRNMQHVQGSKAVAAAANTPAAYPRAAR